MIRKILHKILGIDKVITQLNGRVTLIENIVGINNFMANDEGNIGSGNVGVGSTVPPDVARYQELAKAQSGGNVGSGNVGSGNVGVGSTPPSTAPVEEVVAPATGNVGAGEAPDTSEADGWPRSGGNVGVGSA